MGPSASLCVSCCFDIYLNLDVHMRGMPPCATLNHARVRCRGDLKHALLVNTYDVDSMNACAYDYVRIMCSLAYSCVSEYVRMTCPVKSKLVFLHASVYKHRNRELTSTCAHQNTSSAGGCVCTLMKVARVHACMSHVELCSWVWKVHWPRIL
jgi:hypothetical protein